MAIENNTNSVSYAAKPALGPAELKAYIASGSPEVAAQAAFALSRTPRGAPEHEVVAQVAKTLGIAGHSVEQLKELVKQQETEKVAQSAIALTAQAQELAAQGRSETQISGELAGKGASTAVAQGFAQRGMQEQKQQERQQEVADSDAKYRIEKGIAEPEQAKEAHPLAHLVPDHLKAAIGTAIGGPQHGHDAEVAVAAGGKVAPDTNRGRV